jgi:hypothetical protein
MKYSAKNIYPMRFYKAVTYTSVVGAGMFLWELIGKERKSNFKPSVGLNYTYEKSKWFFEQIGTYVAKMSSFYAYLNLGKMWEIVQDLGKPAIKLAISPTHVIIGYVKQANTYKYPIVIVLGTSTLLVCGVLLARKYLAIGNFLQSRGINMNKLVRSKK